MMNFKLLLFSMIMLALCCFNSTSAQDSLTNDQLDSTFYKRIALHLEMSVFNQLLIANVSTTEPYMGVFLGGLETEYQFKKDQSYYLGGMVLSNLFGEGVEHIGVVKGLNIGKRWIFTENRNYQVKAGMGLSANVYEESHYELQDDSVDPYANKVNHSNVGFGPAFDLAYSFNRKTIFGTDHFSLIVHYSPTIFSTDQLFLYQHYISFGVKIPLLQFDL